MPDLKVSAQTEHVSAILGTDLLPLVGNTTTSPTNYKVQIKNFLSQVQIDLPQTAFSALSITAFATANANVVQAAATFNMVANSSIGATALDRVGLLVTNKIQNGTSNITGQMAVARFVLDAASSPTVAANTFGCIIEHVLDTGVAAARKTQPQAFLAVLDDAGSNTAAKTKYFVELGALGKSVSADMANTNVSVMFSKTTDQTATHMIKLRINNADVWVLCSNTGPA